MAEDEKRAAISAHHNKAAGEIVRQIVKGTIEAGGGSRDVLVLLESVLAGVVLAVVQEQDDQEAVILVAEGALPRIHAIRKAMAEKALLAKAKPVGNG